MKKSLIVLLFLVMLIANAADAQNIFTALHLNEQRAYRFGKPAQIIETNTFYSSNNTQVDKNIKIFDNSGMLLTEERYDENGSLKAKLTYASDTVRHLILQRIFERWTNLGYSKETAIYSYDNQNFLISIKDVNANGNALMVSEIVNNHKGNPTELRLYDGNGNPYGVENAEYFYDKNIAVTTCFSRDGRKLSTDTLKIDFQRVDSSIDKSNYNEKGDALTYTSKNLDGSLTLFENEYVYDAKGNCIDEKIYKVTVNGSGKKKRKLDRYFKKEITYRQE